LGACADLGHWCSSDLKPIEHENDWKNNVPQIKESIEFAKAEWAK
jgi:hypothetical protein